MPPTAVDIVSLCPLKARGCVWRSGAGAHALTVVVKATYLLQQGQSVHAPDQEGVNETDRYWDDNPNSSLLAPGDLLPYKPQADVVLVGHAYTPGQTP